MNDLLVFVGSGAGGWCRYRASALLASSGVLATLLVNGIGCVLLGVLFARLGADAEHRAWLLLGVGFCGGLTTMSTFSLENIRLVQQAQPLPATLYVAGTLMVCLVGCWIGVRIGS